MAWNRPTSNTVDATSSSRPAGRGKMPRLRRGLIAGAIVVLGAGLAAWLLTNGEATSSSLQKKERGRIKSVTPSAAPTNAVSEVKKPVDPYEDYDHKRMYRDKDGILRYNTGCRAFDPTRPRHKPTDPDAGTRRIFKYPSERILAGLIMINPGEKIFLTPNYDDPGLLQDFKDSLKEPIEFLETDTKYDREQKEAVIAVKKEIQERLAKGEKLGDILNETSRELERLGRYAEQVRQNAEQIMAEKGDEFTEQDIRDLVAASNKMLEEQGCNPISDSSFIISHIRHNAERLGLSSEESRATVRKYQDERKAAREKVSAQDNNSEKTNTEEKE